MKYYTDGSTYPQNPGLGGASFVVIGQTKDYVQNFYLGEHITNNEAESTAVFYALEFAINHNDKFFHLYSDSAYVGYGMNRVIQRKKLLSSNIEIWNDIYALYVNSDIKMTVNFVPSHKGIVENETADLLAYLGANSILYDKFLLKGEMDAFKDLCKATKKGRAGTA